MVAWLPGQSTPLVASTDAWTSESCCALAGRERGVDPALKTGGSQARCLAVASKQRAVKPAGSMTEKRVNVVVKIVNKI